MLSGVQYVYSMMRKCIMVKIGVSKKRKLRKKNINFTKIGGISKFSRNRGSLYIMWKKGEYAICIIGLGGWTVEHL